MRSILQVFVWHNYAQVHVSTHTCLDIKCQKHVYLRFWRKRKHNRTWHWEKGTWKFTTSDLSAGKFVNCSDGMPDALLIWVSWQSLLLLMGSGVSIGSQVRAETHLHRKISPFGKVPDTWHRLPVCIRVHTHIYMCAFYLPDTKWPF